MGAINSLRLGFCFCFCFWCFFFVFCFFSVFVSVRFLFSVFVSLFCFVFVSSKPLSCFFQSLNFPSQLSFHWSLTVPLYFKIADWAFVWQGRGLSFIVGSRRERAFDVCAYRSFLRGMLGFPGEKCCLVKQPGCPALWEPWWERRLHTLFGVQTFPYSVLFWRWPLSFLSSLSCAPPSTVSASRVSKQSVSAFFCLREGSHQTE